MVHVMHVGPLMFLPLFICVDMINPTNTGVSKNSDCPPKKKTLVVKLDQIYLDINTHSII